MGKKRINIGKKNIMLNFYKKDTPGNSIDRIRLNGFNNGDYSQHINASIKKRDKIKKMCGAWNVKSRG